MARNPGNPARPASGGTRLPGGVTRAPSGMHAMRRMPPRRSSGWVIYVILGAIAIPLLFAGYYFISKSDASKKALNQAHSNMDKLYALDPGVAKHKDYIQKLINTSHTQAFDKGYKMGAKYEENSAELKDYYGELFKLMLEKARDDGNKEVAEMMSGAALLMALDKMISR
jgi:hypothetical protein